jgi:two-component system, NtrC family, nitrogen regulation sensor histidine kinase GlnL
MSNTENILFYSFNVDRRLRISSWDENSSRIYKKSAPEVQGLAYYKVIPRIKKGSKDAVLEALKTGKPLTLSEYQSICFYGRPKVHIRINPRRDNKGRINGANILIRQPSGCVAFDKLRESKRFIDIGKIAATLAHGVRSPLNAIKGAVVYLREGHVNKKQMAEFTNIIEEEISHLDNFIAKFLSTSIHDEGFLETDINLILKKIEVLVSLQTQSLNIESIFKYGKIFPVNINSFQIEHAILNVIDNAIEAMPSGGKLFVDTKSGVEADKEYTVVEVRDTGGGFVEGNKDLTLSGKKGKGLGLFISREILKSCGGHLEIKSKKRKGTTVKLCIPKGIL